MKRLEDEVGHSELQAKENRTKAEESRWVIQYYFVDSICNSLETKSSIEQVDVVKRWLIRYSKK